MSNITKHKLSCCGRPYKYEWYNNRNLESCPYCDCDKPILEEIDKEEQVLMISGFSGDKRHEERPWGSFTIILDEPNVKIKKIIVKPKQRLSLQYHLYRDEWWKIISGVGSFHSEWEGCKPSVTTVKSGDTVEIAIKERHRITNTGSKNLVFVEVQTGNCKENDIVRIEDDYGRE